jgi:SprB repeat
MKPRMFLFAFILVYVLFLQLSCSKTGSSLPPPPPDPCSFISIGISGSVTNPSASGATDGSIVVSATGGSGFSFSINNGAFKSSDTFSNLSAGSYTVIAKNGEGCSGSITFTLTNPTVNCAGVNIAVSATATSNMVCEANSASITVAASGGVVPYTYSLDGGVFQSSGVFNNVASGSHIITVKDANGCTGSASRNVTNLPIGALFAQVRSLIQYNCLSCHGAIVMNGGISFSGDCNIVANKDRIKARALDGIPSAMPTAGLMSLSDRQKITNWLNAGGRYSD